MFSRKRLELLPKATREKVIAALFKAKFPGFAVKSGIDIDVPAGYSVRVAALLTLEEQREIVKKVFVVMEEFNAFITKVDIDTIVEYTEQLKETGVFHPERDDFYLVTNQRWTYEAFTYAKGKIVLMDLDTVIEVINKYLEKESRRAETLKKDLERLGLRVD